MTSITREQRDALRLEILDGLYAIGDLSIALNQQDYEQAQRYRQRFEDEMRLLDDLGWTEEDERARFELTLPAEQLKPTLKRMSEQAEGAIQQFEQDWREGRESAERARTVAIICSKLLGETKHTLAYAPSSRD
jgi:hypothetical protein